MACHGRIKITNLSISPNFTRSTTLFFRAPAGAPDPEVEQIVLQHNHDDGSGKTPRDYEINAINAAIEAMAILSTHPGTIDRDLEGYRPD